MIEKHYPAYLREYRGQEHIETDYGFISYIVQEANKSIYLADVYVVPAKRHEHLGHKLIEMVKDVGRERDCTQLLTHVFMDYRKKEESLLCALYGGGKIIAIDPVKLTLSMEIECK
jgi:hypothetical protein